MSVRAWCFVLVVWAAFVALAVAASTNQARAVDLLNECMSDGYTAAQCWNGEDSTP